MKLEIKSRHIDTMTDLNIEETTTNMTQFSDLLKGGNLVVLDCSDVNRGIFI